MQTGLTEKQRRILEAVVVSYIRSGVPVGSSNLSRIWKPELSPAGIRNVMAELERLGFLVKPHISAGRVPTEAGYRFYVDRFMKPGSLSRREIKAIHDAVARDAVESRLSVGRILERVSKQIESLSHMASLALLETQGDYSTYVFGTGNIVSGLADLAQATSLLRVLESREAVARALLAGTAGAGVTVTIGSENRSKPMKGCSVVSSPYRGAGARGAIGVIGPLRMEYARLVALIDFTSRELTDHLAKRGGRHHSAN
jgi:transcriptional regulator of heat shock response